MNLIDINKTFKTDDDCIEYLAKWRWPEGIRCLTCGTDKVKQYASPTKKQPTRKVYQCQEPTCKQQFTATSGTIFHDTHLPLVKWFMALALVVDAKKGISAKQLQRHLSVGYKTAWYLAHRIREAMNEPNGIKLSGTVEMDETYIGGRQRNPGRGKATTNKHVVVGIRERGGDLKLFHAKDAKKETLINYIQKHISPETEVLITDELPAYKYATGNIPHETVNHGRKEYVRFGTDIHTNTVESAFSLLKRGVVGTYHIISIAHLQRYLNEFTYRFNRREEPNRFEETLSRMTRTKPLPFSTLTSDTKEEIAEPF